MHSIGSFEDDGAASAATRRWGVNNSATSWMREYNSAGTELWGFYLNSFLSNGFRITYQTVNNSLAHIVNYAVFWGSDITVNSGSFAARTTTGSDTIAHGLAGAPSFAMFLATGLVSNDSNNTHAQVAIGMASSTTTSNQACVASSCRHGSVQIDTFRYMPTDKAFGLIDTSTTTPTVDATATVTTMDSTNIILNWSDPPTSAAIVSWLAILGGKHDVHAMTAPASTGNQSKTGLSFTPEGLFAFSRGTTAGTTVVDHGMLSVGAAKSSTNHRNSLYASENGTANSANCEALVRSSSLYAIETCTTAIAASASSTAAPNVQIELVSFNSGGYTWNYDATVSGNIIGVWNFAQGNTAYSYPINETTSVSDQLVRTNATLSRTLTEPTQAVSDSLAVSKGNNPTINESGITVSDGLAVQFNANRTITEAQIQISEAIQSQAGLTPDISEQPISVFDALQRNVTISHTITEPTVSVGDSLSKSKGTSLSITEPPVYILGEHEFNMDEFNVNEFGSNPYETLRAQSGHNRTITEPAVSISDGLASNFGKARTITEDPIAISDALSYSRTFNATITEPAIIVSDALAVGAQQNINRTINEPAIAVSDNLTVTVPRVRGRTRRITSSNAPQRIETRKSRGEDVEA